MLCVLVLWVLLDCGPCPCLNGADRTGLTDGPPQLGKARGEGGWVGARGGGCARYRVIRGNVFSRIRGGRTSGESDSPNPLSLGVAPGGFMSPR